MTFRTILLAADMAPESASTVDYAFKLAEKLGATVHTLHANPYVAHDGSEDEKLERVLARHRGSASLGKSLIGNDDPVSAILSAASEVAADLIIMGTHARRGMQHVLVGSTAEGVLRDAMIPVLVLRADGPA